MILTTRVTSIALALLLCLNTASPIRASAGTSCAGDCDGDGVVTVDEIVRLVAAVLEGGIAGCPAGDTDRDQRITVDEVVAALTTALFGCDLSPPGADLVFQFPRPRLPVGDEPTAVAVGDLDGDGRADLATVGTGADTVSILLQNPGGGFAPEDRVAVGLGPADVRAATLGAARTPAFLVADSGSDELIVLSHRDGGFETASVPTGEYPIELAVIDLNGDGWSDVVVANRDSGDVSVLLGDEDGAVVPAGRFQVGGSPTAVTAGDLDRDGTPDVLAVLASAQVAFLRGTGDGNLEAPMAIEIGVGAIDAEITDLDGDQFGDLVVLEDGPVFRIVALTGGDQGFEQTAQPSGAEPPLVMSVADVDGDGATDVVSGNPASVSVFFGRGDGSFHDELALRTEAAVSAVEVADVDGDGLEDIVYTAFAGNEVSMFRGLGGREFSSERNYAVGGRLPAKLLSADVDADGLPDLATLNGGSDDISILRNTGGGTFADPVVVAVPSGLLAIAFGRFDHDHFPDLVAGYENSTCADCLDVFRAIGDGGFDAPATFGTMPRIRALAAGRLNADTIDDIISLGPNGISVLTGLGSLMFAPAETFGAGDDPLAMAVADVNGDNFDDVATVNAGSISILLATGTGGFSPPMTTVTSTAFSSIGAADLDADGAIDLVAGRGDRVVPFFGLGDGRFAAGSVVLGVSAGAGFDLADANGDGRVDLAVIADGLAIYPGVGASVFAAPRRFVSHPLAVQALVGDFNADGVADVATVNSELNGSVSVILGASP